MEEKEINLIDYWNVLWQKRKFIVITVMIVTMLSVTISLFLPLWYKSTTTIMIPSGGGNSFGGLGASLSSFGLGNVFGGSEDQLKIMTILKSKKMLELLDEKFDFQAKYEEKYKFKTYKKLKSNYRVEVGEEDQIFISILDTDQNKVADMSNYVVHCLDSLNIAFNTSKAKNNREFVENRINITMDSLSFYENKTTDFMEENGIISLNEQLIVEVEKAAEMKAEIMAQEIELALKKEMLSPQNQQIKALEISLNLLSAKYDDFFKDTSNDKLLINLGNVPNLQKQFARLKRKVMYFSKLLEFLAPQYEQAKIEEVRNIPTIQVIDEAKRPEWKTKPKRAKFVVVFFTISLILSCYVALFMKKK
ncbi:MAG: hypothetical protein HN952_05710 [Candidatus Cloacimonetes bacterium]|jgi:tyrosine-protein kinase Etk/Wzc|nr:hypothetical protein [Candidatus Cloacimonadota bacterium]MBT6994435.1 hypothetical protein [Candidatus Cloacimonadota bacterium]MBT7470151.1 hypothetical protein [Candidatus Cloacimonadota bacterium]